MGLVSLFKTFIGVLQPGWQVGQPESFDGNPEADPMLHCVRSRDELMSRTFSSRANCFRYSRTMPGDFNALARLLYDEHAQEGIKKNPRQDVPVIKKILEHLQGEEGGIAEAAANVREDIAFAEENFFFVELRLQGYRYKHGDNTNCLHIDGSVLADNGGALLCPYTDPTTRAARLKDCSVDNSMERGGRNFKLLPGRQGYRFQPGEMFRMAVTGNTLKAKPFIHAADDVQIPDEVRMLLVARRLRFDP